jgi:hypothetical protein
MSRTLANKNLDRNLEVKRIYENALRQISALRQEGVEIKELSPFHFRVQGYLDVFPKSLSWHNIKTNSRGTLVRMWDSLMDNGKGTGISQTQELYNFIKNIES